MPKARPARPPVPAAPPSRTAPFAPSAILSSAAGAALLAIGAAAAAAAPGTVNRVEVTGVTRQVAAVWIRATVASPPASTPPERLVFQGTISAGDVVLPVRGPVGVTLQRRAAEGPAEAVFAPDVDLARLPPGILALAGSPFFPVVLRGTIRASGGSAPGGGAPVLAEGRLRPGAPDVVAPASGAASFARFSGASLGGVSLQGASGEASVSVFNPLGFDLLVEEIRYELRSGERTLFRGSRRGVRLHAGRENEVGLPLEVAYADLLAAAGGTVRSGGTFSGRLVAQVTVKAGTGRIVVPVDQSGAVRLVP